MASSLTSCSSVFSSSSQSTEFETLEACELALEVREEVLEVDESMLLCSCPLPSEIVAGDSVICSSTAIGSVCMWTSESLTVIIESVGRGMFSGLISDSSTTSPALELVCLLSSVIFAVVSHVGVGKKG